jgi:Cu+-exporting ATPase
VRVVCGTRKLLAEEGIDLSRAEASVAVFEDSGETVLLVAVDGRLAGLIAVADTIKPESREVVRLLESSGREVYMITGDNARTARAIAEQAGIDPKRVLAEVMPERKASEVARLQDEGRVVAMAGDGINDAPALARADVGIAMGTGTDVAMNSAQLTLVKGDLRGIATARDLSVATVANMKQNLAFAFVYNALGIPLAAGLLYPFTGWLLSPMIAALAMSLSSVSVIGNALRLRAVRIQPGASHPSP